MQNNTLQIWCYKKLSNDEEKLGEINRDINNIITKYTDNNLIDKNVNMIFQNIWLGNLIAANDFNFLSKENVKYIISATSNIPKKHTSIEYIIYPISDIDACYNNYIVIMDKSADIINKAIHENNKILINCKRGHHRSASIIAFYLMKYHNMKLADAIFLIKQKRPHAFRRMTCMLKTLILYEYGKSLLLSNDTDNSFKDSFRNQ